MRHVLECGADLQGKPYNASMQYAAFDEHHWPLEGAQYP